MNESQENNLKAQERAQQAAWTCEYCNQHGHPMDHGCSSVILKHKISELQARIAELEKEKAAYREVAIGISARNLGSIELKQNDRVKDCWNEAQSIIDAEAKRILEEKK